MQRLTLTISHRHFNTTSYWIELYAAIKTMGFVNLKSKENKLIAANSKIMPVKILNIRCKKDP